MVNTRLELGDVNVAIVENVAVPITFRLNDVREPDKVKGSFTKTVTLYGTNEINKIFENVFEVNIQLNTFNPNKKIVAKYYVNDVLNFKGNLQLNKVSLNADNNIVYDCNILGENVDIFTAIGESELTDLDFSAYDHTYNRTNQIASWANYNLGSGYYYGFVNNGNNNGSDSVFNVKDFIPCLSAREYIDKIFAAKGFTFTSDFLDTDEFKSIWIYPNIDKLELTQSQLDNRQFFVGLNADYTITPNSAYIVNFPNESLPFFDAGNQVSGTYAQIAQSGYYNIIASNKIEVTFSHTDSNVSYAIIQNLQPITQLRYSPDNTNWYVLNSNANILQDPTTSSKFTINNSQSKEFTHEVASGEVFRNANDYIESRFILDNTAYTITYYNSSNVVITPTGTLTLTYKLKSGTNKTSFYMLASQKEVSEGNALEMASVLPKKIKQKDFLKSIIQAFNLIIEPDKDNANNVIIEPYSAFYGVDTEDWSNKLDTDKDITINPLFLLEGRRYIYKYKEDKDYYNTLYKNRYNEIFGQNIITVDNDFLTQDKTNELVFSPTPMVANYDLGIAYPKIQTINANVISKCVPNIRMLYAGGVKNTVNPYTYKQSGQTDLITTEYGYLGHIDDTDAPTLDLNFDYPKEVFYNFVGSQFTSNNLYNRFHKNFVTNITDKNSKTMTCYIYLNPIDINKFSFRKKYYVNGAYWIVNTLEYNPMVEDSFKVELIKVLTLESHTPTSFKLYSSTTINTGNGVELAQPAESFKIGTNTVNKGTNCVAIGDNIYIPASCEGVIVIGDNIQVDENTTNVTYLNGSVISGFTQGSQKEVTVDEYTLTVDDDIILANPTLGVITLTLPNANTCISNGISKEFTIVRMSNDYSNPDNCRINTNDGALIVGEVSIYLTTKYDSITVFTDGVEWFIK